MEEKTKYARANVHQKTEVDTISLDGHFKQLDGISSDYLL